MKTPTIPTVTLNNGVEMPILRFGVYQIPPGQTEAAVSAALAVGYRSLDTAAAYLNEAAVGHAIKASGIAREELFVTTKLWVQDQGDEAARRAFETSLDRLVDLVEHNDIAPAINQVETHPFYQHTDDQALMDELGVRIESWGPFAEGRNHLFTDPALSKVAAAHAKSVAQVVLRWLIQRGIVVIPKSVRPERMRENIDVFDFELTPDEMAGIAGLDTGSSLFFDHHDPKVVQRIGTTRIH